MRIVLLILLALLITLGGGYLSLAKPYLSQEIQRTREQPEEILVEYVAQTCDPFAPRLVEPGSLAATDRPIQGLTLALPTDLQSPEDSDWGVAGNRFVLTGYRYKKVLRNWVTGRRTEQPSSRVDVLGWRGVHPLTKWIKVGSEEPVPRVVPEQPVQSFTGNKSTAVELFHMRKYNDCP